MEANITNSVIEDSVKFIYNSTAFTNSVAQNNYPIDVKNNGYNGSIILNPYSSAVLLNKNNNVTSAPLQCSATGNILRQVWNHVGGNNIMDNTWTNVPTSSNLISSFEGPSDVADNYASRILGYLCAPQTGNYTFWIAGDDATELWLSTDDNPSNKRKIAYSVSWTFSREWERYSTQKSAQIYLEAGKKYYIEALHKEGAGGDNIAVAWQLPNGVKEAPMTGRNLLPPNSNHVQNSIALANKSATVALKIFEPEKTLSGLFIKVYPNPISSIAKIKLQSSEAGRLSVDLYDIQNRFLFTIFNNYVEKNVVKTFVLASDKLPSGTYFIKCVTNQKQVTEKIIIAK